MPTLRSWELRYGMPTAGRGFGRHRRYLPADVHALRLMRDEISKGLPAGRAAGVVREMLVISGPAGRLVQAVLTCSENLDGAGVKRCLDEAAELLGLAQAADRVLLPAVRQVGLWWAAGHCDVAQEQLTTEAVLGWVDKRSAFAPQPVHGGPVLLTCGPADHHTLGLEVLAMLLRYRGWPCRVLGARVRTEAVLAAAVATGAVAVVVVSHLASSRRQAVATLRAARQLGLPIFYAGNAFTAGRSRGRLLGSYLGSSMQQACCQVIDEVSIQAPSTRTSNRCDTGRGTQ